MSFRDEAAVKAPSLAEALELLNLLDKKFQKLNGAVLVMIRSTRHSESRPDVMTQGVGRFA